MAISKAQARKVRQPTLVGDLELTDLLNASNTSEVIELSNVSEKVTIQSDGTLAGTVEFSTNGTDFYGSTAFTATVPLTYNTHLVRVVRVTRTGGAGRLHLVAL
jgi:hypothetical protein